MTITPRPSTRSVGLDVLRAGCVAAVLATHFAPFFLATDGAAGWVRQALSIGSFGVTGFFLLSAYLLTGILLREVDARQPQVWRRYWIRRSLRIWPLYFLLIMVFVVVGLVMNVPVVGLGWLATFTYNWVSWNEPNGVLSHFWSMCAEEQLYLLVPILSFVAFRWRWPVLLGLIVVAPLSRWWVSEHLPYPAVWNFTTSHLDVFAIGVLLASLDHAGSPGWRRVRSSIATRRSIALLVFAGVAGLVLITAIDPGRIFGGTAATWTYAAVALGWSFALLKLTRRTWSSERPTLKATVWMGRRSYGIYVYHWPLVVFGAWLGSVTAIPPAVIGIVLLGLLLVVSEASFRWFESPFLRLKARFSRDPDTLRRNATD